ncbi:hypothetical protein Plhal304r1_c016g0059931 [Plasmopara halstedii]
MKKAIECPLACNNALSLKMTGDGAIIDELAQLHTINLLLSATQPGQDFTFATKWKKVIGITVLSKRIGIFIICFKWWISMSSRCES